MATNANVNKVVYGNTTLIDLTSDTVTAGTLMKGVTAHDRSGALITGTLEVETTPIGTVIYYAGKTAPEGYLACDGTVYNISAYPELAAFFQTHYGSRNYWGGNGGTTFAVPNWQGEFFRAAGSNSRSGQGSGADVGVHQDATQVGLCYAGSSATAVIAARKTGTGGAGGKIRSSADAAFDMTSTYASAPATASAYNTGDEYPETVATRPANTSLLVCIRAAAVDNMAAIVPAVLAALPAASVSGSTLVIPEKGEVS